MMFSTRQLAVAMGVLTSATGVVNGARTGNEEAYDYVSISIDVFTEFQTPLQAYGSMPHSPIPLPLIAGARVLIHRHNSKIIVGGGSEFNLWEATRRREIIY